MNPYSKRKSLLVDSVLEGLAGTELRCCGSSNLDFLAGLRVAAGAGCALRGLEGTEADQGNLVLLLQSLRNY